MYLSYKQVPDGGFPFYAPKDLVINSSRLRKIYCRDPEIIHQADPEQPIPNIRTMEDVLAGKTESRTIQMRVLVVFTGVAIGLAGLGLYGLLAFMVSMRQQELTLSGLSAGPGHLFTNGTTSGHQTGSGRAAARAGTSRHRSQAHAEPCLPAGAPTELLTFATARVP